MEDFTRFNSQTSATAGYDAGLRAYMIKVFNYMFIALGVSGATSYFAGTSPAFVNMISTHHALVYLLMFAPLIFVLIFSRTANRATLQTTQLMFWGFSVIMGLSLWFIFALYTQSDITKTFLITAATFGGMSLFGYTTKRDLTGMGHFMIMGVFGIMIAMLVNIFLKSPVLDFAVSIIGVIAFTGLTAYDVQKIKRNYYAVSGNSEAAGKYAIFGALSLYLDFINLFLFLLRLTSGNRR